LVGLGSVVPIRRQAVAAGVYEDEIEGLLWDNLEDLTGDNLFRVARQPVLALGWPDVVALDATGRIVVIEVKRDVDRGRSPRPCSTPGGPVVSGSMISPRGITVGRVCPGRTGWSSPGPPRRCWSSRIRD
jgi:hypothetical protein